MIFHCREQCFQCKRFVLPYEQQYVYGDLTRLLSGFHCVTRDFTCNFNIFTSIAYSITFLIYEVYVGSKRKVDLAHCNKYFLAMMINVMLTCYYVNRCVLFLRQYDLWIFTSWTIFGYYFSSNWIWWIACLC